MNEIGKRYIGLDVHKHYLIALGVDRELNVVLPARRVELVHLEAWMKKTLTKQDEVVLEMTTNTWQLYDELVEYAGSVMVVHPPHVALITRSQVMNDKIAASILTRLLAKGLLVGIWVPPEEVRELRGLVAQRQKMTRLATQANSHPHWKAELARLQPRLGYNKAIVAIARKLLVTVWHVLTGKVADRFAEPEKVSKKMLHFAYEVGKVNRAGKSAAQFTRERMDTLGMGQDLTSIPWGSKKPILLPPSKLKKESDVPNK